MADSSWINAQKYRDNVREWIDFLDLESLKKSFLLTNNLEFEKMMQILIYPRIEEVGFGENKGQVTSRHLELKGFQCQFENPSLDREKISRLMELIGGIFGWKVPELPRDYKLIQGKRNSGRLAEVLGNRSLGEFIKDENVFSYVIPNFERINWTVF